MSTWKYNGKDLIDSDIPEKAVGFCYLITQISTGRKYLGKKLLTMAATKTVDGKKKKIRKESNWKDYWSSSPTLTEYIEENGTNDFIREIIMWCYTKSEMLYMEESLLYHTDSMLSDGWWNNNIRSKIYKSWYAKNMQDFKLRMDLAKAKL